MSTKFLSPGWRMPRNANQSKSTNYSLNFDGTSSYVSLGSVSNINTDFTVSGWINTTNLTTSNGAFRGWFSSGTFNNANQFAINISTLSNYGGVGFINVWEGNSMKIAGTSSVADGNWHHVILTKTSTQLKLYVDGSLQNTVSNSSTWTWNNVYIGIGNSNQTFGTQGLFDGKISQVCIFDYALSDGGVSVGSTATGQIATLWGGGTSVSNPMALPSPPKSYYPLGTSAYNGEYLAENNAIGDYVFDFDGSIYGQQIGISNTSLINGYTAATFSFWFKGKSGLASFDGLLCQSSTAGRYTKIHVDSATGSTNYRIYIQQNAGGVYTSAYTADNLDLDKWFHVCVKGTVGGKWTIYINGSDATIGQGSNNIAAIYQDGAEFKIGRDSGTAVGELSNVQIFNTELPATGSNSVETLYNNGSPLTSMSGFTSLQGWYKLDASEVYNSSSTEWSVDNNKYPSAYLSSLYFANGANNKITITPSGSPTYSAYSVSVWINPTTFAGDFARIFEFTTNQRFFGLRSTGAIVSGFYPWSGNELTTTAVLSTNRWYHLVFVDNGTSTIVYIDKVGETLNTSSSTGGSNWYIGNDNNDRLNSKLSNVQVFNTALSQSDVNTLYNNGTPLTDVSSFSSLVSWWKLNNTTTGIQDSAGSNNGTNSGATEYPGFVNALAGESSGMSQANLVQSDLQTVAPYSKYAMNFDGTDYIDCGNDSSLEITGNFTISAWINITSSSGYIRLLGKSTTSNNRCNYGIGFYNTQPSVIGNSSGAWISHYSSATALSTGVWHHIVGVYDGTNFLLYANGSLDTANSASGFNVATAASETSGQRLYIGATTANQENFTGKISNVSIWNAALTASQVKEIYNQGLPGNLNSHSAYSNLVSWWQLGENSSYVGGATNPWTFADEKGTNNGLSPNLPETDLTNGVGTTANGVSNGMSEGNLVGDAPYSTANAISSGMSVVSRVTGSGNTP